MSRWCAALLFALAACGGDDPETPDGAEGAGERVDASSSAVSDAAIAHDAATPLDSGDAALADAAIDGAIADGAIADGSTPDGSIADGSTAGASTDAASADAASEPVPDASTQADASTPVTYEDVAPILNKYCVSCHSPGGNGPFSLDSYDDASDYGAEAYAAASARIMPPCADADPSCGPTSAELATMRAWVLQGTPQ